MNASHRLKQKYRDLIQSHYIQTWRCQAEMVEFSDGPTWELPAEFAVLRFPPHGTRTMWTYATRCMSQPSDQSPLELHLFTPIRCDAVAELLYATAHFHRTGHPLDLGHGVNFGRPWLSGSQCSHGLLSLPYLDGPSLEWLQIGSIPVRFLWLVPITDMEAKFARQHGPDALEARLEESRFNYLDAERISTV